MSSYGKDPSGPCTCPAPCTVERHQNQDFHDEGNATNHLNSACSKERCGEDPIPERRSAADRRQAVDSQTLPTGDSKIVLDAVLAHIAEMVGCQSISLNGGFALSADLKARAEMGLKKYGTKLRVNNGRRAMVDLYQEVQDALMYAMQCRLEGDDFGGMYVESFMLYACQIAGELDRRG